MQSHHTHTITYQRPSSHQNHLNNHQPRRRQSYTNNFKAHSSQKSLNNPQEGTSSHTYYHKDQTLVNKAPRTFSKNVHISHAVRAQRFNNNETVRAAHQYSKVGNSEVPALSSLRRTSQVGGVFSCGFSDVAFQVSELSGFKIVQNGVTLHDETSDGKPISINSEAVSTFVTFSYEDRFKPFTESLLTVGPCSQAISLPEFIEAQE